MMHTEQKKADIGLAAEMAAAFEIKELFGLSMNCTA